MAQLLDRLLFEPKPNTCYNEGMQDNLPKDKTKPFTINGIRFANRKEYDERIEHDLDALAHLLFDIYKDKKAKESSDATSPESK